MIMKQHTEVGVRLLYVFMILHINIRNLIFVDNKMRSLWSFCQSFIQSSRTDGRSDGRYGSPAGGQAHGTDRL